MQQHEIQTIQSVAKALSHKFSFGYYGPEDIEQEAFIIGMKAINRYDSDKGSLYNFLYIHISNRLKSFLRDNYVRRNFECKLCDDNTCDNCQRRHWRFAIKKNLMEPVDIDNINQDIESNMYTSVNFLEKLETDEIFLIINNNLDMSLRMDYLRMLEGIYVSKNRRELIEHTILNILEEHGYGK